MTENASPHPKVSVANSPCTAGLSIGDCLESVREQSDSSALDSILVEQLRLR